MNKFGHVHIWYICPPPKNFFLFLHFFMKWNTVIFQENLSGKKANIRKYFGKRRAFGFYRNNNSGHNRCELLTLEIHFLESV